MKLINNNFLIRVKSRTQIELCCTVCIGVVHTYSVSHISLTGLEALAERHQKKHHEDKS